MHWKFDFDVSTKKHRAGFKEWKKVGGNEEAEFGWNPERDWNRKLEVDEIIEYRAAPTAAATAAMAAAAAAAAAAATAEEWVKIRMPILDVAFYEVAKTQKHGWEKSSSGFFFLSYFFLSRKPVIKGTRRYRLTYFGCILNASIILTSPYKRYLELF